MPASDSAIKDLSHSLQLMHLLEKMSLISSSAIGSFSWSPDPTRLEAGTRTELTKTSTTVAMTGWTGMLLSQICLERWYGNEESCTMGGRHSTVVAFALLTQPSRVRFLPFPNSFKKFDVAEIYQQLHCLRESGQYKKKRIETIKY